MNAPATQENLTGRFISLFCRETPPLPTTVRLDLTPPDADGVDPGSHMSWDFFVRVAREIRREGIEDLVLAHQGDAFECTWLPEAITFAKHFCQFPHVVLRADVLTPDARQIRGAIRAGLDCLVLNFNLACPDWRAAALRRLDDNPGFFAEKLAGAKSAREAFFIESGQRCSLYVATLGRRESGQAELDAAVRSLAEAADHHTFEERRDLASPFRGAPVGGCRCWTPFTEAHVSADGFLVACRHDYNGRSNIADLRQMGFAEAWHEPAFQCLRRALLNGETRGTSCASCAGNDAGAGT